MSQSADDNQEANVENSGGDRYRNDVDGDLILTVRALMHGREVGSIIGKKGETVRQLREESETKIHISDGSSSDRIVTVTGNMEGISKAFKLITEKMNEYFKRQTGDWNGPLAPLVFKLIVPATQCGSIIGRGGQKIKEIRESSGAAIQVSSDMLPNSSERVVTITGTPDTISQCIYTVCLVLLESPPRGAVIPYHPKPLSSGFGGYQGNNFSGGDQIGKLSGTGSFSSLGGLAGLGNLGGGGFGAARFAAVAGSQLKLSGFRKGQGNVQTQEMTVPNEFIGCVIGKGGSKIAEIRSTSGAYIRISNNEEAREGENGAIERPITIQGTPEAITVAKHLINLSVDLQKASLEAQRSAAEEGEADGENSFGNHVMGSRSGGGSGGDNSSLAMAAKLLSKPGALNALSNLSEFLGGGGGGMDGGPRYPGHGLTTGFSHRRYGRMRNPNSDMDKSKDRKFTPY